MRATVDRIHDETYTVRTTNDLAIVFRIIDGSELRVGEEVDIALPSALESKTIRRASDGTVVAIAVSRFDVHDLRLQPKHGSPSNLTDERMIGP